MKEGPQTWDELEKEPVSVKRACISLDGTRIAAVFADKTLCIYDATVGDAILPPFKVNEYPPSMIFSRNGKIVALGGRKLRLWNVETGEKVQSFDIEVYSLALSPDGTCIAAGCEARNTPQGRRYRDSDGMDMSNSYNIRVINMGLVKIPDDNDPFVKLRLTGRIQLKGEILSSPFKGHKDHVRSVAYSADGKQIASCSNDWAVRVWDVSTGSSRTFKSDSNEIHSVAFFSPDSTQIVSDIGLFNLFTGSFTPHTFGNEKKAISLFGISKKKTVSVFGDFKKVITPSSGNREKAGFPFAFSADGRFLTSGSPSRMACQIWDIKSHDSIVQLSGHIDHVASVAFFPDGKMMSASEDGSIRVWNIELLKDREEMDGWRIVKGKDGRWILGPDEEHLFWTSLPIQHTRNTLVIGKCLKIDVTNFVHGDEWWKCGAPLQRKEGPQGIEVIGDAVTVAKE